MVRQPLVADRFYPGSRSECLRELQSCTPARASISLEIQRIRAVEAHNIVAEAAAHRNACGPGAVAATIAACVEFGADEAILVEHTTSAETLGGLSSIPVTDAVGYSGFVFAKPTTTAGA